MPLASVQQYIRASIDNLQMPNGIPALKAYITPPPVQNMNGPVAHVLGAHLTGQRQTMPRGKGFKQLGWVVDVYLAYETTPKSAIVDVAFPSIIDGVMARAWTLPATTFIDDSGNPLGTTLPPGTTSATQLLNVGENFELEYPPERVPETLRMLYYVARLGFNVYEAVQA